VCRQRWRICRFVAAASSRLRFLFVLSRRTLAPALAHVKRAACNICLKSCGQHPENTPISTTLLTTGEAAETSFVLSFCIALWRVCASSAREVSFMLRPLPYFLGDSKKRPLQASEKACVAPRGSRITQRLLPLEAQGPSKRHRTALRTLSSSDGFRHTIFVRTWFD
jgi:hypothetical protein